MTSSKDIRLNGRVAIVTGAARGLGRAMAQALARAGAAVVFADIDAARLAAAIEPLAGTERCGPTIAIGCDITRRADCERVTAQTIDSFGALHILVNNAAKGMAHIERAAETKSFKFWEADPEVWQQVIATNVNGTFLLARSVVPAMLAAGWGRIINITTSLGTMQRYANSPYGVSKAAIEAETLIWAQDLAGTGVTVNSLLPGGAVDTEFVAEQSRREMREAGRKLLQPEVVIPPALFLASALSDGVSGKRFVGKLWDDRLPPQEAAKQACEPPVLLPPAPDAR